MKDMDKEVFKQVEKELLEMYDRDLTQFRKIGRAFMTLLQGFNYEARRR